MDFCGLSRRSKSDRCRSEGAGHRRHGRRPAPEFAKISRDGFLCLLPFFHTYAITGTFLLPLLNGSKMVLVDRFQPTKVLGLIQEHKVSAFLAIPSMYRVLAGTEGNFDLSSVRFPISGGEPLPPAVA